MSDTIKLLDTVALLRDAPEFGLSKGQVGTVVEFLDEATLLVEFVDSEGVTFSMPSVKRSDLLKLAYEQQAAE